MTEQLSLSSIARSVSHECRILIIGKTEARVERGIRELSALCAVFVN